jgi:hypothetical protein
MKEHRIDDRGVWVDTYRGHRIATQREQSVWRVILDDVALKGVGFETPQEATAWLRRRVDDRIAEAIFPGLARN